MNTTKERTAADGKAITKKGDPYTLYKLQSKSASCNQHKINVYNRCTPKSSFEFNLAVFNDGLSDAVSLQLESYRLCWFGQVCDNWF